MLGGDRPFSMLLTVRLPQNPAGGKAWPVARQLVYFVRNTMQRQAG